MPQEQNYDVIIVGAGAAGLYAALNLEKEAKVLLLSKKELALSNSSLAQGGVASVVYRENDDPELHFQDTLIAGKHQNNPDAVRVLVNEGPQDVLNIQRLGVDFDLAGDGRIQMTLEAGHSRHRIAHHKDSTGKEIVDKLAGLYQIPVEDLLDEYNQFLYKGQGRLIREYRERMGLQKKSFARWLGIDPRTLRGWENETIRVKRGSWERYFKESIEIS